MAVKKGSPEPVDYTTHPDSVIVRPDLLDLTVGQVEEVEEIIDGPLWGTLGDQTLKQGKVQRAIAFVVRKAQDPDFTWEQSAVLRLLMVMPKVDGEENPEVPPTNGRGSSTGSRSRSTSRSSPGRTSKP